MAATSSGSGYLLRLTLGRGRRRRFNRNGSRARVRSSWLRVLHAGNGAGYRFRSRWFRWLGCRRRRRSALNGRRFASAADFSVRGASSVSRWAATAGSASTATGFELAFEAAGSSSSPRGTARTAGSAAAGSAGLGAVEDALCVERPAIRQGQRTFPAVMPPPSDAGQRPQAALQPQRVSSSRPEQLAPRPPRGERRGLRVPQPLVPRAWVPWKATLCVERPAIRQWQRTSSGSGTSSVLRWAATAGGASTATGLELWRPEQLAPRPPMRRGNGAGYGFRSRWFRWLGCRGRRALR